MDEERDLKKPLEVLSSGIRESCRSGKDAVFLSVPFF